MTLHDDDERLHAPPDPLPGNWQENLFFICWDTSTHTGLVAHVQRVPGADVQAAQVAVAVDGQFASATSPPRTGPACSSPSCAHAGRAVAALEHPARREGRRRGRPPRLLAAQPGGETAIAAT